MATLTKKDVILKEFRKLLDSCAATSISGNVFLIIQIICIIILLTICINS